MGPVLRALRLIGQGGILLLVDRALPGALPVLLGPLLRQHPETEVLAGVAELGRVPDGGVVVLCPRAADADWMNLHRPLFARRGLKVVLWSDAATTVALRLGAPDFFDWISHRIECPAQAPPHGVNGLRALAAAGVAGCVYRDDSFRAALAAAFPDRGLREVSAALPYLELLDGVRGAGRDLLVFRDAEDDFRVRRVRWALAECRVGLPALLSGEAGPVRGWWRLHGQYQEMGAALSRLSGARRPGVVAGLLELLGLAYARRYREQYQAGFLVRADSDIALHGGLLEVARRLGLRTDLAPAERQREIRGWLEKTKGALLILDNADDLTLVKELCRSGARAHILLTTRAGDLSAVGIVRPLHLAVMASEDAQRFLLERAGRVETSEAERAALAQLAAELGHLPLALAQAGAYIAERKMLFADYLIDFRQRRPALLQERPEGGDYPDPVAKTWSINMQEVEKESPASAAMLKMSAFLAPDAVPEELLSEGAPELGPELSQALAGKDHTATATAIDEALRPLLRYSLIDRDVEQRTYRVHRLVQAVVQDGLTEAERRQWAERVVRALNLVFPDVVYENWGQCERLVAHVRRAAELIEKWGLDLVEAGRLLDQAGGYIWEQAQYADAEPLLTRSLAIREKALGPDHPDVGSSLDNLARLYQDQGKYALAEPLFTRSLAISEKALGPDHPDVAPSLNNLAGLYWAQGKYAPVEPLYTRSLAISEKALGRDHPDVATVLNNLATCYQDEDKYAQAEPLYTRSLAIRERALGSDHPDVATSLNNLAGLYQDQGKYAQAEPLYTRSLAIFEKALGPDHPHVARALNNLAGLYRAQGRHDEARLLAARASAISK